MMKKAYKLVIVSLTIVLLLLANGCKEKESIGNFTNSTAEPTSEPTPGTTPIPSLEELSIESYEKFLNNEMKVSFDLPMPKIDFGEALFKEGTDYLLSEVLRTITSKYFEYRTNKKIKYMDYGYIDCGKDGVKELVLRLNGMDIYSENDNSTLVFIIKYIDGKLSLCYYYETWARCEYRLNEYGYIISAGSNGASNHGVEYSIIDKDGIWHLIVYIESEKDINQLAYSDGLEQIPEVAEKKGIYNGIELNIIRFDYNEKSTDSDGIVDNECLYTFYAYDENWEPIEDTNLYTDSKYKDIFDEASVHLLRQMRFLI